MAGFKALVTWATSDGRYQIDLNLPPSDNKGDNVPCLLNSYTLGEMATILNPSRLILSHKEFIVKLGTIKRTQRAILRCIDS